MKGRCGYNLGGQVAEMGQRLRALDAGLVDPGLICEDMSNLNEEYETTDRQRGRKWL